MELKVEARASLSSGSSIQRDGNRLDAGGHPGSKSFPFNKTRWNHRLDPGGRADPYGTACHPVALCGAAG